MRKKVNTARRRFDKGFEIFEFDGSYGGHGQGGNILRAVSGHVVIGDNELWTKPDTSFDAKFDADSGHDACSQSV